MTAIAWGSPEQQKKAKSIKPQGIAIDVWAFYWRRPLSILFHYPRDLFIFTGPVSIIILNEVWHSQNSLSSNMQHPYHNPPADPWGY